MNKWVVAYGRLIVKFRWLVVLAAIAGALFLAGGGRFIEFSNDYRYFFTEQNPNLQAFERLERTYTSPDTLLWVLRPNEGKITTPERLAIVKDITERAWQTPFSIRVDSLTNYQHTRAEEDDLTVRDLVDNPQDLTQAQADTVGEIALGEPVIANRLISDDETTTAIVATLKMPRDDQVATSSVMTYARELLADMREKHPEIRFELTGSVALSSSFSEAAQRDLKTLTPAMYLVLALAVYFLTRSIPGTIATILVVTLSAAAAMGLVMG